MFPVRPHDSSREANIYHLLIGEHDQTQTYRHTRSNPVLSFSPVKGKLLVTHWRNASYLVRFYLSFQSQYQKY